MAAYQRTSLLLIGTLLAAVAAQADEVRPGNYESANGLLLVSNDHGALKFQLDSVGANGHTCSLGGVTDGRRAQIETEQDTCVVEFRLDGSGVNVAGSDACRSFCGARASFEGLYLKPAHGCAASERADARKRFQRSYETKDYPAARLRIEPLLTSCDGVLGWLEKASLRNDLAVTLYHLHARDACLVVLAPLKDDATKSDAELRDEYPPLDADAYLPLVKAARVNLKLCDSLALMP